MLPQNKPDRIRILFDDHRLVANAGLLLPATLARHLGLRELVDHHLDLGGAPGRANTGDKMLTLVASALAGGDCIDDADALRAGGTDHPLGAPPHFASPPALALGNPVQSRLGPAASHSVPGLTASLQLTQRPRNLAPPRSRESPAAYPLAIPRIATPA